MSTVSGFILGVAGAAALTVVYGGQLAESLRVVLPMPTPVPVERVAQQQAVGAETAGPVVEQITSSPIARAPGSETQLAPVSENQPHAENPDDTVARPAEPGLEQRWEEFAAQAGSLQAAGEFPWRACFRRAAASYALPEPLLLAIASGESNFDPAARSDKDAIGLMQIRWPLTSRHLGIRREADLYDPCTNVDAGARYLVELAERFDHKLHLMVAAYNYGPARISSGNVPEGARWYSQYIFQHLQRVLGREHIATSDLLPSAAESGSGYQVLLRFDRSYRARDFIAYLRAQAPDIDLQQKSEALGQHEVVLLYRDESERRQSLEAIRRTGLAPLAMPANNQIPL